MISARRQRSDRPRLAAAAIFLAAATTIGGALAFEHVVGLVPCKLCLIQRYPYYAALPIALLLAVVPTGRSPHRAGLALLALLFLVSAGLGAYHAGVEWGWWAGPNDCGGGTAPGTGSVDNFLNTLQNTRVVSCTEAPWRLLGLSLAGWNALISLGLAALAVWALDRERVFEVQHVR
jgi:disulfide bond formation protein DsbB